MCRRTLLAAPRAGVQGGDPGGRLPDPGAQFRRVEDLRLGAEGEHVEHRDIGRVDPHPGLDPVLAPGNDARAPADPDVRWPAQQGGQPPTGLSGERPQASTVPSCAGFCSSALPSGTQSPRSFSIACRSSMQRR